MKILFGTLLLFSIAASSSTEIIVGGPTYHLIGMGSENALHPKWDPAGRLIGTPLLGIGFLTEDATNYAANKFFIGDNCVGQPIQGFDIAVGKKVAQWYLGMVMGLYVQNNQTFLDAGANTYLMGQIGDYGLVPIAGVEANYRIELGHDKYLKFNTFISPIINETISYGF